MERLQEKVKYRRRRNDDRRMHNRARRILTWNNPPVLDQEPEDGKLWYSYYPKKWFEDNIRRQYNNMAKCSCPMCGNARRHFGEITLEEKRFRQLMEDQINDLVH